MLGLSVLSVASAFTLSRCEVTVALPVGTVAVPAYGVSDADAGARAVRVATLVAAVHASPRVWFGLLADGDAVRESVADGNEAEVAPGHTLGAPLCTRLRAASGETTATWGVGEHVTRGDPAAAAESARRRACAPKLGVPRPTAVYVTEAVDRWVRCMTTDDLIVAPSSRPRPSVPSVCAVALANDDGRWWLPAWGSTEDLAREDALRESVYDQLVYVAGKEWREAKPTMVLDALERLGTLGAGPDEAQQRSVPCAPAVPGRIQFASEGDCPSAGEDLAILDATATQVCGSTDAQIGRDAESWRTADPSQAARFAALRWERLGRCTLTCRLGLSGPGFLVTAGARSQSARLRDAAVNKDLGLVAELTGGVVLGPHLLKMATEQPDAFFQSLIDAVDAGRCETWDLVLGHPIVRFEP